MSQMITRYEQMTRCYSVSKSKPLDGYCNFIGDDSEYQDWLGFLGQHKNSHALERSNFRCGLKMIGGEGENVRVERYKHWAVGWIEEIYVRPDTPEAKKAQEIRDSLEDYPVVDEDGFSDEEQEEADTIWKNCYTWKERIKYIRTHRNQFDFYDLPHMIGCVRGEYFNGYASELLY